MRVGILGSGLMGGKHGTTFARAGHEVLFSPARSEQKLQRLARDAQGKAWAGTLAGSKLKMQGRSHTDSSGLSKTEKGRVGQRKA